MYVSGTQHIRRKQGRVAEFCPACQALRPFKLTRIGLAGHLWFISITSGRLVGYEARCEVCDVTLDVDGRYGTPVRSRKAGLDELIEQTNPGLRDEFGEVLALRERAARGEATDDERRELVLDALRFHVPLLHEEAARPAWRLQGRVRDAFWLAVVLGALTVFIVALDAEEARPIAMGTAAGCLLVVAIIVWIQATRVRRFVGREVVPRLARALAPIDPAERELRDVLHDLESDGHAAGRLLDSAALFRRIRLARVEQRAP